MNTFIIIIVNCEKRNFVVVAVSCVCGCVCAYVLACVRA